MSGITPACAGKSKASYGDVVVNKDHPRVCGEKSIGYLGILLLEGSPPRVRGKD